MNTAKNYLDPQGRRPPGSDVETEERGADGRGQPACATRPRRSASLLTERSARTVERAIDALPEDLRTAIMLREIEGLSYEEIAEVMDCPIGTVRSRIFRAREAIDIELKPLLER